MHTLAVCGVLALHFQVQFTLESPACHCCFDERQEESRVTICYACGVGIEAGGATTLLLSHQTAQLVVPMINEVSIRIS